MSLSTKMEGGNEAKRNYAFDVVEEVPRKNFVEAKLMECVKRSGQNNVYTVTDLFARVASAFTNDYHKS